MSLRSNVCNVCNVGRRRTNKVELEPQQLPLVPLNLGAHRALVARQLEKLRCRERRGAARRVRVRAVPLVHLRPQLRTQQMRLSRASEGGLAFWRGWGVGASGEIALEIEIAVEIGLRRQVVGDGPRVVRRRSKES